MTSGAFEVFELTPDGTYARVLAATEGLVAAVPGCEGLVLDLDALWSELATVPPGPDWRSHADEAHLALARR